MMVQNQDDMMERQRRLRGKNLAMLVALLAFVALLYVITMVRIKGG